MNKGSIAGVVVILIIVLAAVWYVTSSSDQTGADDAGGAVTLASLSGLALTDLAGAPAGLAEHGGKPLVVNAWASWCPFCIDELPAFVTLQQELGDSVTIVAIDRAESASVAMEYIDQLGIRDELVWLLDPTDYFYGQIGGFSMPETLFFNSDGSLGFHKRGPMDVAEIRQRIEALD
jgi:thiol-disulfide isomerase/thioredoxin